MKSCERVREDEKVFERLVKALNRFGEEVKRVCKAMTKELSRLKEVGGGTEIGPENYMPLLEVQVSGSGCESYEWSKDGQPLLEGVDFCGVSSYMLYVNRVSKCTQGKYCCCVSNGTESICSDEIELTVLYSPEKEHLIEFYSMENEVPKDSWPPQGNSIYVNLVLVKQKPMSKCDYYTVRGDMDDILESKEVVEYEDVFREFNERALVLVEGRPGSRKTTLVHKLARDWATGKQVLQGAKFVFLVSLRLIHFLNLDDSIADLLKYFYENEFYRRTVQSEIQEHSGKGVCFILDGLGEYPLDRKKGLVINQLISKKSLLFSMVVVASRSVATNEIKLSVLRSLDFQRNKYKHILRLILLVLNLIKINLQWLD